MSRRTTAWVDLAALWSQAAAHEGRRAIRIQRNKRRRRRRR